MKEFKEKINNYFENMFIDQRNINYNQIRTATQEHNSKYKLSGKRVNIFITCVYQFLDQDRSKRNWQRSDQKLECYPDSKQQ